MTNEELRMLCERVFQLDKTGFTSDDRPWSWRDDTSLDDCSGNTLLQTDENKIKSVDNVKEIIVEYRDACPALARSCLRLLDENAAMRGVVDAAHGVTSIWEKMKVVDNLDIRKYYAVMQEFCDEYGALKISLRKLGERA